MVRNVVRGLCAGDFWGVVNPSTELLATLDTILSQEKAKRYNALYKVKRGLLIHRKRSPFSHKRRLNATRLCAGVLFYSTAHFKSSKSVEI